MLRDASPVIAVVRADTATHARELAEATVEGGVCNVEITLTVPDAWGIIAAMRAAHPEIAVGVGTVSTAEDIERAIAEGLDFSVSPWLDPELLEIAQSHGLQHVPGVLTPSEARLASSLGANLLKLYPASSVGPSHLGALSSVLPHARFMPTGGIDDVESLGAWMDAGARFVGVGSTFNREFWRSGVEGVAALAGQFTRAAAVRALARSCGKV